jgi:ribonuclease VapC
MTFVDASALVAVICNEDGSTDVAARLEGDEPFITSPVAIYEATLGVARRTNIAAAQARKDVEELITRVGILPVSLTPEDADLAIAAFERFGKGQNNKAQLNMGDCFAYAVAKSRNAAILFVGDDFTHTDLPDALAGV